MANPFLQDPDWLRARYIDDELTLAEVADLAGVPNQNRTTVRRALFRPGIPMRTLCGAMTGGTHVGVPHNEEAKRKLSEKSKGVPRKGEWEPEARRDMGRSRHGAANHS